MGDREAARYAVLYWSRRYEPEGCWSLHLLQPDEQPSPVLARWAPSPLPPTLLERYDGLAAIGYAVAEGGPDAWSWAEETADDGSVLFSAIADVRLLNVDDLSPRSLAGYELPGPDGGSTT